MSAEQDGRVEPARDETDDETEAGGRHHAKDGEDLHPLIDLDRDPNPGVADHAAPEKD